MKLSEQTAGHKASLSSPYIEPGADYLFEIKRLLSGKKTKGNMFIAELEVLEILRQTADINPFSKKPVTPNKVGSVPAWRVKLTGTAEDPGAGNVLAFFLALWGCDESYLATPEGGNAMDAAAPDDSNRLPMAQPYEFHLIKGSAFEIQTKKTGMPFTILRWEHVPMDDTRKAAIARVKAELETQKRIGGR